MWFANGAAFDEIIKEKFLGLHEQACNAELRHWQSNPQAMLALIILLDQFSRHIYRGQARSFAQDSDAIDCAKRGIKRGVDSELFFVQRQFFYMPLMHAEDLATQQLSIEMFSTLHDEVPGEQKDRYAKTLSVAQSHYYVIEKFGRFPELNEILGRTSTPEEREFLATGKYRFL